MDLLLCLELRKFPITYKEPIKMLRIEKFHIKRWFNYRFEIEKFQTSAVENKI